MRNAECGIKLRENVSKKNKVDGSLCLSSKAGIAYSKFICLNLLLVKLLCVDGWWFLTICFENGKIQKILCETSEFFMFYLLVFFSKIIATTSAVKPATSFPMITGTMCSSL